jgi:hypothetical protein
MKGANLCASLLLLALGTTGCSHKSASPPLQAQAPPLQTGKGTLSPPDTAQQQEKSETPLASPLPPPPAQSVPLPPPTPKKVRKKPKPAPSKSTDTTQTAGATPAASGATAQVATPVSVAGGPGSPIGQLTTGDSALGERTKHETADLIGGTQQGLNGIKRSLSTDEQVTASQIRTFLKEAQQELDTGDTDGAHTLATKAKLLLDELTKP